MRRLAVFSLLLLTLAAHAQVPTPDAFLGYALGDRFTSYDRILDYFDELTKKSNLITVEKFGETYEGRPLVLATITSPANRARLNEIRGNVAKLANGEGDPAEIAKSTPAVVWLAFGVHGNESSSAEAAMQVAATLLNGSAESARLLDELVILIDPLQNPDGRERYIQWFTRTRGVAANTNPDAFEHVEPWPGGRFNHYMIDMNRDWAWSSQKESQARIVLYPRWNPQVFVDFHEMSAQSTYFFPPDAKPINVNLPRDVEKWLETFGRANADEFSKRGWVFFVGERFDLFYPGYGDSWPSLRGAVGMTYEVAGGGRAGSAIEREDATVLTLADRVNRHFTTAMSTLRTSAANREALLRYTHDAARTYADTGRHTYFLLPGSPNFDHLVELLQRQGIRVNALAAPARLSATPVDEDGAAMRNFPAGTAVVTTRQPLGGLVQTLLEKTPTFTKGFLEDQRAKAEFDEADDFYDITAWSLPLAMNVEAYWTTAPATLELRPYAAPARASFTAAPYGYLVDGLEPNVYRVAGRLLRNKVSFSVSDREVVVGDRRFARGTLVILKAANPNIDATLGNLARELNVAVFPLQSGWAGGTSFGSEDIRFVKDPKIALVGGAGVGATSFGMLWHTLDVDTPIPHTVLSLDSLAGIDLSRYRVLVLPDGNSYADRLGKRGIERLQTWIRGGGTLVAVKDASRFLREKDIEISKLKPWEPPKPKEKDEQPADQRYNEFRVPGSAFRTSMNERSYLTMGLPQPPAVLIEGSDAFRPLAHRVDNIVTLDAKNPLISGVAWPESLERLKGSVFLTSEPYGRGTVITFADDPHFRLFWRGTLPLFLNAVLYSPTFPR